MTRFYVFLLLLVRRQSPGHFVRSSAARCLVIFLLSANVGLAQTIRYVRAGGTGDGSSWPTASGNLQAMINATGVQQVWVASGTYKPTTGTDRSISFSMKNGVSILGGFAASGNPALADRNPATHPTTLSGEINNDNDLAGNSYHVINNSGLDNTARLGGFIITGGNARGGTNAFIDNVGGAISNTNSNPSLTSCSFQNNAARNGGAVSNRDNSNPSLTNCSFFNNTAVDDGGAIYNGSSSPGLINCSFQNNSAGDDGGAIYNVTSSNPSLTNCSFFNNTAQDGGAIFNFINGNSTLTNCVLFGNGGDETIEFLSASGTSASYCLFDDTVTNYTGSDNRTTATTPFISTTDLRLNVCAPAINAGDNAAYSTANGPATDLAGQARVVNTTIDMGAFEFQTTPNTPLTITTQPVAASTICAGATVSVAVSVNGTLASNPYQWFRNGASVPGQTSNTLSLPNPQTSDQGSYVLGITGACNSLTSNAFALTVNPNPSLSLQATPSLTITSGQTSLLTASGATGYRWSTEETTPAISVSVAGPYSVTGTTGGCSSVTSVVVSITVPCGAVVYVTEAGAGLQNGSSWTNAFSGTALQTAINTAAGCGAQVWVARGLYKPTTTMDRTISFSMKKGVAIYGGFSGNGTETMVSQRNWTTNPTILSGDIDGTPDAITGSGSTLSITGNGGNSYHVINNQTNGLRADARLDGFTITGGNANGSDFPNNSGGGMYGSMVSPTVINCVFTGNTAATNGGGMYHAGYYDRNNNETPSGVVYMKVTNCTFSNNKATSGGGMYMYVGLNMTLDNVVFSKNAATGSNGSGGGGLFLSDSRPTLSNVVFSENAAERWGGAISTFGTNAYIANGTFSNNTVAGTATEDAGGISFSNDITTGLYLLNCVFWNNRIGNNTIKSLGRDVRYIYAANCDFQDLSSLTALNKTNCIDQDPQFTDANDPDGSDNQWMTADDGLSVRSTSPVVNAGVGSTQTVGNSTNTLNAPSTDIVGNPRPYMNTAVDMGAYEFQGNTSLTLASSASPNPVCAGATVALSVTASGGTAGMPDQPYSYTWAAPAGITLSATSTSAVSASIGTGLSGPQTFTITVASSGGSPTSTSLVSVSVNALPTATLLPTSATLTCASPGVTLMAGGGSSYTLTGGAGTQTNTNGQFMVSQADTYTVTVANASGCMSTTTATVVNATSVLLTWTGTTGTDWNMASNWCPARVPLTTDDVVIPSAPTNQPVLSTTAVAKSVAVQTGASLSISSAGSLTINSFATLGGFPNAFYNQGTVTNNGTLMLGNTAPVGLIGLHNTGTFTNTGTLQVDRATNQGINNRATATFANTGIITIGASVSMGTQGIWNQATFTHTGGTITIDRITGDGLLNSGNFVNSATITIGSSASVTGNGIQVDGGTFDNNAGGSIQIDHTAQFGFLTNGSGTVHNSGAITTGSSFSTTLSGVLSGGAFTNNIDGTITINRAGGFGGLNNSGTFINAGHIAVGEAALNNQDGIENYASFTNSATGEIRVGRANLNGIWNVGGTFRNDGAILIGTVATVVATGILNTGSSFSNTAGASIQLNRVGRGLTNTSLLTNAGQIRMGNNVPLGERGFLNGNGSGTVAAVFNNLAGSLIQIDQTAAGQDGITNEVMTTFTNAGTVTVGTSGTIGGNGITNAGTVSNSACATLTVFDNINNSGGITNAGLFTVNTTQAHTNTGTLTNNGLIEYPQGNPIPNVTNNDVIAAPVSSCGNTVSPALQLGGNSNQFTVATTWYKDQALTQPVGTYNQASNTFTISNLTAGSTTTLYFVATDNTSSCPRTVSVSVTTNPLPAVSIAPSAVTICAGQSTSLTATPGLTYRWSTTQTTPGISVSVAGPYSVTATNPTTGCSNTATANVTVTPLPMAPTIATQTGQPYPGGQSNLTIAQNVGNVILTASGCAGGTITWAGGMATTLAVSTVNTGTQTFTATCQTDGCTSPAATATLTVVPTTLSVRSRDPDNGQLTSNTIKPYFQLQNVGNQSIAYDQISLRYWLTAEEFAPFAFQTGYVAPGSNNLRIRYVALDQPRQGAFGYVEYSFLGSAGNLGAGANSGEIQNSFVKQTYSPFNQADDYSYLNQGNYAPNARMTAYVGGTIVWGQEPGLVAPQSRLRVYTQQENGPNANSISTTLNLRNEGNLPVAYGAVTVRYYFTSEGTSPLNVNFNYAQPGRDNVIARFVRLSPALAGADTYLELSFNGGLGSLSPLSSTGNLQYQLVKSDYSYFSMSDDHSYQGTGGLVANDRVVVYVDGVRVAGIEPGSGARLGTQEPDMLRVRVVGNPVSGPEVSVEVTGAEGQPLRLHVTDITGRLVSERSIERAGPVERQTVPVGGQGAGLLFLRVSTPTQSQTVKLLNAH